MPSIRTRQDVGKPTEREVWLPIQDPKVDSDGYLAIFSVVGSDGSVKNYHVYRRNLSLVDLATTIFGAATSLRSAKGLLEELAVVAKRERWSKSAGIGGMAFGSASLLHEYLKTRPFQKEGYYDSAGTLVRDKLIHTKDGHEYKP